MQLLQIFPTSWFKQLRLHLVMQLLWIWDKWHEMRRGGAQLGESRDLLHGEPPNTSHVNILNTYVNTDRHRGLKLTQLA